MDNTASQITTMPWLPQPKIPNFPFPNSSLGIHGWKLCFQSHDLWLQSKVV
ncbi:MAG: hypothetical protein K0U68_14845 [Gammaproteobacteria bacterium]|nr:hypothetical protein [Gammaproteobacteria bacterium]